MEIKKETRYITSEDTMIKIEIRAVERVMSRLGKSHINNTAGTI